jgi:integrase
MTKALFSQRDLEAYKTLKPVKLAVAPGLRLYVSPKGIKTWFVRYSIADVMTERALGAFGHGEGEYTLVQALAELATIKAAAKQKRDHLEDERRAAAEARANGEDMTVADLYAVWHPTIAIKRGRRHGRKDGGAYVDFVWNKHLSPAFGGVELRRLTRQTVSAALSKISASGRTPMAIIAFKVLMQMMRWADKRNPYRRLLIDSDLLGMTEAEDVIVGDYDPRDSERARILSDIELPDLAARLKRTTMPERGKLLVKIMLGTGTRVGETVAMKREDIDLDAGVWNIPASDTKTGVAHTVYLSEFVKRQFAALFELAPPKGYLCPARGHKDRPVGETAITPNSVSTWLNLRQKDDIEPGIIPREEVGVLKLAGGRWTPHDLRRTAATTMQRLGADKAIVHRCLAHATDTKLDRTYLHHRYEVEMRDAWEKLGAHLDVLMGDPEPAAAGLPPMLEAA